MYFEITCVIWVLGRAVVPHASMRAWRLVPLPEIRTVMLYLASAMVCRLFEEKQWDVCGERRASSLYGTMTVKLPSEALRLEGNLGVG